MALLQNRFDATVIASLGRNHACYDRAGRLAGSLILQKTEKPPSCSARTIDTKDIAEDSSTCDLTSCEHEFNLDLGHTDIITKCADLLTTPNALLRFYLDLSNCSLNDPIKQTLAFHLQARFKLVLPFKAAYLDQRYADAMLNSSVVNDAYNLLPIRYKERFDEVNPLSGFTHFFSGAEISHIERGRIASILELKPPHHDPNYRKNAEIYDLTLDLLLENVPLINDDFGSQKLPSYQQERSDKRTADLIEGLWGYFERNDYGGINHHQLWVLAECMAYMKRFYRKRWRVEVEDVLEAWYIINHCKKPRPHLGRRILKILGRVKAQNREGKFPTQRQIIKQTGLAYNTVSQAIGLKIKSKEGAGLLLVQRYLDYDDDQGGYRITDLGELALDSDFHITIGTETYQPKNPLES
jgi:hypothetical protein